MGLIDKALSTIGYTKSLTPAQMLSIIEASANNQVAQPYANVPSVYKAIKAVIDNVTQAEPSMINREGQDVDDNTGFIQLLSNVKNECGEVLSFNDFLQACAGFYCLYNEVLLIKDAETAGQLAGTRLPNSLMIVDPTKLQYTADADGYIRVYKIGSKSYKPEQLIRMKDWNPYSCLKSVRSINVIMDELKSESGISEFTWALFVNGATPSMVLKTEKNLTNGQKDQLRSSWENRHKGSKKAGKMALLEGGMQIETLGQNNNELQLSELTKRLEEKIIGMWRVPKSMFGYTDGINHATFLGQLKVFWTMMLIPILNKFEDNFNDKILAPTGAKLRFRFDLSNIEALRDNLESKANVAKTYNDMGVPLNDIIDKMELPFEKTNWGDVAYQPFSMVPAGEASIADVQATDAEKSAKKNIDDVLEINGLTYTKSQLAFIKNFNKLHDSIHVNYTKAVKRYFNGLRKRVLDSFDDGFKGFANVVDKRVEININWLNEKDMFTEDVDQYQLQAMEQGVKTGQSATGIKPSDTLQYKISSATLQRLDFLSDSVTATNAKEINSIINSSIDSGDSVEQVKSKIKGYFNRANNRADTIARTEITAQLNGGLLMQYGDVGVTQKEWLTNIDGFERESHALINHEIRNINEPFSNGLMMPGGYGSPEETINCRCSVLPVLAEG